MGESRNQQTSVGMKNIFAVILKMGIYFFLRKVKSICPVYLPTFQQCNRGILTIVVLLKVAIVQAGIEHQHQVIQVE